jgi:hypothetical protein
MNKNYAFLLLIVSLQCYGLKIERVILATDDNPLYIQFWPIVAKAWKEIVGIQPTLALIADETVMVDESLGDVIRFAPIDGVPTSFHAQVIRLLLPIYFEQGCIISDIDMLPLSKEYFLNSVAHIPENNFIVYRNKTYSAQAKQYPMCYIAARGNTFKEVFGITNVQQIPALVKQWHTLNIGWYSDEVLLYWYLQQWKYRSMRCTLLNHTVSKRIDREQWAYDPELLKNNYYIDAHLPRPYHDKKNTIDQLVHILFR